MKRATVIGVMIGALFAFSVRADAGYPGVARLNYTDGTVLILDRRIDTEWLEAAANTPLMPGGRLWTPGAARAEIQLPRGVYLRIDEDTVLEMEEVSAGPEGDLFTIVQHRGRLYINTIPSPGGSTIRVHTPDVTVTAVRRVRFMVDVLDGGYTVVTVIEGAVGIDGPLDPLRLAAGRRFSSRDWRVTPVMVVLLQDGWYRWNLSRDAVLAGGGPSRRYLPAELWGFGYDLDRYGYWEYTVEYGYVWRPRTVAAGWAPYRFGRWLWYGDDYVWVSDEPWGWLPYHYGRWVYLAGIGWCWVPPSGVTAWSPGLVAWFFTADSIAWVPLAPGESYYGYSRITNITTVNVTHIYMNAGVEKAVTVARGKRPDRRQRLIRGGDELPAVKRYLNRPLRHVRERAAVKRSVRYRPGGEDLPTAVRPPHQQGVRRVIGKPPKRSERAKGVSAPGDDRRPGRRWKRTKRMEGRALTQPPSTADGYRGKKTERRDGGYRTLRKGRGRSPAMRSGGRAWREASVKRGPVRKDTGDRPPRRVKRGRRPGRETAGGVVLATEPRPSRSMP